MNKLSQPFNGFFKITQGFGQNLNDFYKLEGKLGHGGIDFAMPNGTPVLAPCDGKVIFASTPETSARTGYGISILSDAIFDYNGTPCHLSCLHAHLKAGSLTVKRGDIVKQGDIIALSNNTGQTTGPHLHFGVAPLDLQTGEELVKDNGYGGYVDPLPYLDLIASPVAPITRTFSHTWTVPVEKVKAFQATHGLKADGIIGPLTQKQIDLLI